MWQDCVNCLIRMKRDAWDAAFSKQNESMSNILPEAIKSCIDFISAFIKTNLEVYLKYFAIEKVDYFL